MSTTSIKRLYQGNQEFVPITLAEAVVVNATNIAGLAQITTLDKVLSHAFGISLSNASSINTLNTAVENINKALAGKQDALKAGTGINISSDGTISVTNSIELYKIVSSLPTASADCANSIYIVANGSVSGNLFKEYLCVNISGSYNWEEIGTISSTIDLSGYYNKEEIDTKIQGLQTSINILNSSSITAANITDSKGAAIVVDYTIPEDLYDSLV